VEKILKSLREKGRIELDLKRKNDESKLKKRKNDSSDSQDEFNRADNEEHASFDRE